jgi:alpha-mannosidase
MQAKLQEIIDILASNELQISWKSIIGDVKGAENPDHDDGSWGDGWKPIQGNRWDTAWLRGTIPPCPLLKGAPITGKVLVGGFCTVWIDGQQVAEGYEPTIELPAEKIADGLSLVIRSQPGQLSHEMMEMIVFDGGKLRQIETARRGLWFVGEWLKAQPKHRDPIEAVLDRYANAVDPEIAESDPDRFWEQVIVATTYLKDLDFLAKDYTVHVVPHSHVDLAWGWDFTETKRLSKALFDEALRIMDTDDDYTFIQDQPPMYVHLEDSATEKAIRERVKEGRWDIPGATFSEPESFVPGGESWVRHMMYTKHYFKSRFDKDIRVHWAPDNFSGHAGTLPQIWKLCGVDFFAFGNWYQANHGGQFMWEGLDGSRVFSHYFTSHYDSAQMIEQDKTIKSVLSHMSSTDLGKCMLLDGDDLCPPWEASIAGIERLRSLPAFPNVEFSTPHRFFDDVDSDGEGMRVLTGELISTYDEPERKNNVGAYSTFMPVKYRNRRSEWGLRTAEALSTIALRRGALYAQKHLSRAWRLTLFNQMHDILPGTAIHKAYDEAYRRMDEAESIANISTNAVVNVLTAGIDTRGEGMPIGLFNTLGSDRSDSAEVVLTEMHTYDEGFEAVDSAGRSVPCQIIESDLGTFDKTNKNYRVLVKPDSVPAMGHEVVWLKPTPVEEPRHSSMVGPDGFSLDNEHLRVRINPRTGFLSEIYDKTLGRNILPEGREGCELLAWADRGNPWHLWPEGASWTLNDDIDIEVVEDGDVRAAIRVTTAWAESAFVQEFRLERDSHTLDVHVEIELDNPDIVCRMALPLDLSPEAPWTCEVPWGAVERPMPIETLKYVRTTEVVERTNDRASQTWMDVSGSDWGVAVLNDGRYGTSRMLDGTMTLTLIRSVVAHKSAEQTDLGHHEFTYSVMPHAGAWKDAGVVQAAHALNSPMWVHRDIAHEGDAAARAGVLSISSSNVVLAALKKAEDNDDWILHLYETTGRETSATIAFDREIAEAIETDLVEWNKLGDVGIDGKAMSLSFRAWEIKGIRLRLS